LLALLRGSHTSLLALLTQCGGFWLLGQSSFPLGYCTAFTFGLLKEVNMLEMIANILAMTALLALGAIFFVFVCAMIGWAVFTMQNGGDDD
jgi:hypothetical protein